LVVGRCKSPDGERFIGLATVASAPKTVRLKIDHEEESLPALRLGIMAAPAVAAAPLISETLPLTYRRGDVPPDASFPQRLGIFREATVWLAVTVGDEERRDRRHKAKKNQFVRTTA
jgi:hypothetical protein